MGSMPLELTVISAKGLKDIGKLSKMDVYVAVTINGDSRTEQRTPVDQDGGSSPKWSHPMKFTIDEKAAEANKIKLDFRLRHERVVFGDKDVGEVHLPIKELLDKAGDNANSVLAEFPVRTSSGKERGKLKISYKLGNTAAAAPTFDQSKNTAGTNYLPPGPVMLPPGTNYPPPAGYPPQQAGYPMPGPGPSSYGYPPAGYPPPPQYGGYPGAPPPQYGGYQGAPPPQYGGYQGAPPPGGYPYYQQPPKKSGGGMGMGAAVGVGVLGGVVGALVLDDIVSDVADDYGGGFDCDF